MDSASLCLVSLNAYHRIYPQSFFRRILEIKDLENVRNSLVFQGFGRLAGLAKEKKDYFVILKLIESNVDAVYQMLRTGRVEGFSNEIERSRWETDSETLNTFEKYLREEEAKL